MQHVPPWYIFKCLWIGFYSRVSSMLCRILCCWERVHSMHHLSPGNLLREQQEHIMHQLPCRHVFKCNREDQQQQLLTLSARNLCRKQWDP